MRLRAVTGLIVLAAVVMAGLPAISPASAEAAASVELYADSGGRVTHRPVFIGTPLGFHLEADGVDVSSVSWTSSSPAVARVATLAGDDAHATVTGLAEGVAKVTATAQTSAGTLSDSMMITVGTPFTAVEAVLNRTIALLGDATSGSLAATSTWPAGKQVSIAGVSGSYFFVEQPPEGWPTMPDTGAARWVARSAVDVPPSSVTVAPSVLEVPRGTTSAPLTKTIAGPYANDVSWAWSSSAPAVATVNSAGRVSGIAEGTASIVGTASSSHGVTVDDSSLVTVYTPLTAAQQAAGHPITTATVRVAANSTAPPAANLTSAQSLTIVGTAGTYYRVRTSAGVTGYVARAAITVPVTRVTLSPAAVKLSSKQQARLTASIMPALATNHTISWASSNPRIATVSAAGVVTGLGSGVVTIKAAADGQAGTATVTVIIHVTQVTLPAKTTVLSGKTVALTATVRPSDATDKRLTWSTSNPAIATVSAQGVVTGRKGGTTKITATSLDGHNSAVTVVTVKVIHVTGISTKTAAIKLLAGKQRQVGAKVSPANATLKTVTWTSSNPRVATVGPAGLITAKTPGSATITVRTVDGHKTATVAVTVPASTLATRGQMPIPTRLPRGRGVTVTGSVTSNYAITTVGAAIETRSGRVVYQAQAHPHTTRFDLRTLDAALHFGHLAIGPYTYRVWAQDSSGKALTLRRTPFAVLGPSTLRITHPTHIPATVLTGTRITTRGTIVTNYFLTSVSVTIKTNRGTVRYHATVDSPHGRVNLTSLANQLRFDKLAAGKYVYTVTASDSSGTTKTLQRTAFTVKKPSNYYPILRYMVDHMVSTANSPAVAGMRHSYGQPKVKCGHVYGVPVCYPNPNYWRKAQALHAFATKVHKNGPWDYKPVLRKAFQLDIHNLDTLYSEIPGTKYRIFYDAWGNIFYGYIGRAIGIGQRLLTLEQDVPIPFIGNGPSATDRVNVISGINSWNTRGYGLVYADLDSTVRSSVSKLISAGGTGHGAAIVPKKQD